MTNSLWRRAAAVSAAACAAFSVLPITSASAANGTVHDVPAVEILPLGTTIHDPNQGTWFVLRMKAGEHLDGTAQLINPADVPQRVQLYPRELDFTSDGTPVVSNDPQAGIASWVTFDKTTLVVPPGQRIHVGYSVDVPHVVEPGDHTGVLVVESAPRNIGGRFLLHKRIATRFYVTTPGKAIVAFRLGGLTHKVDNPLWPGSESVHVTVTNTGNVRFVPAVFVNGTPMTGSTLVMARSIEPYAGTVHVPWYGGPIHVKIAATANGGAPQYLSETVWVIPWGLIALALILIVAIVQGWLYGRRRRRRRREERLALHEQQALLQQQIEELQAKTKAASVPAQRSPSSAGLSSFARLRRRDS